MVWNSAILALLGVARVSGLSLADVGFPSTQEYRLPNLMHNISGEACGDAYARE